MYLHVQKQKKNLDQVLMRIIIMHAFERVDAKKKLQDLKEQTLKKLHDLKE
jgi:hypothetical protein